MQPDDVASDFVVTTLNPQGELILNRVSEGPLKTAKPLILQPTQLYIIMYLSFPTFRNNMIDRIT